MSEQAQPVAARPGGLGSGFTRLPRKPDSVPDDASATPGARTPAAPATGPATPAVARTEPQPDRPDATPLTAPAAKQTAHQGADQTVKRATTAKRATRGSTPPEAAAPAKASDTVAVNRRTVFLPDDVFDALALRRATTHLTNSNLILLALDALHPRLPELITAARRPAQFDSPSSLFGSLPVMTRIDGSGGRRQISVLWSTQVLHTVDLLVQTCGAQNRSQMISIVLREWLQHELDTSGKS